MYVTATNWVPEHGLLTMAEYLYYTSLRSIPQPSFPETTIKDLCTSKQGQGGTL